MTTLNPPLQVECCLTLQRCSSSHGAQALLITLKFHLIRVLIKLPVYSTRSMKFRPPVLRSFEDTIMMRYNYLPTKVIEQALIVVPTLEKELVFIYRHVGQSIRLHRFSMGRSYVAPSTHHPSTSQALNNIRTVSGYDLLYISHCILLIVSSVS